MNTKTFDLEDRLVEFSEKVIEVVEALPNTRAGNYVAGQLIRCGIAPALLYGEAQAAESRMDFIHKIKIVLKELKETRICLKLIGKISMIKHIERLVEIKSENAELVSIIAKSIETAKKNLNKTST
jgi:four helix bundle protein